MQLSGLMSKAITGEYEQVDNFIGKTRLSIGKHGKIRAGIVALIYHCPKCANHRTFCSGAELVCVGVNKRLVSVDCALKCSVGDSTVQMWFLIEFELFMLSQSLMVRIVNKCEKLSEDVLFSEEKHGDLSTFLEKANVAFREGLRAGATVYLRKILETITIRTANLVGIEYAKFETGNLRNFTELLENVDEERHIIPKEFSKDRRRFFKELSGVVHGNSSEEDALTKFVPIMRLTIGILDNLKNNQELLAALGTLGWTKWR